MEAPNYIIISLVTVLFGVARYFFKDLHKSFLESEKKNAEILVICEGSNWTEEITI